MIRIIGTTGCSRCIAKKNEYTKKQIDFSYELLENLSQEEQDKILKYAEENKIFSFPIIIEN